MTAAPTAPRSPVLAALLSTLVPGLGQGFVQPLVPRRGNPAGDPGGGWHGRLVWHNQSGILHLSGSGYGIFGMRSAWQKGERARS